MPVSMASPESAYFFFALPPRALAKTRTLCRRELLRSFEQMDEDQLELFMDEWFSEETQDAMNALVERLKAKS